MRKLLLAVAAIIGFTALFAQDKRMFKGKFYNRQNGITIAIDLYDTTVTAPNYSFLGKMHGYMTGRLYDAWFITDCKVEGNKAAVRFSNDLGADEQDILFSFDKQGRLLYEVQGANNVRRVENRKWVKLPAKMVFENKDSLKKEENYLDRLKSKSSKK